MTTVNDNSKVEFMRLKRNTIHSGPSPTTVTVLTRSATVNDAKVESIKPLIESTSLKISTDYLSNAFRTVDIQTLMNRKKEIESLTSKQTTPPKIVEILEDTDIETIQLSSENPQRPRLAFQDPEKEKETLQKSKSIAPLILDISKSLSELGLGVTLTTPLLIHPKLFQRIPKDFLVRCKIYRRKSLLDKTRPTFFMYNESGDAFMLSARKRKGLKSVGYLISTSPDDLSKDSKHYVAKLK